MPNLVDIIINASWRGGDDVKRAQKDLGKIDDTAKKTSSGFSSLATTVGAASLAFYAGSRAARAMWQALEEGASLELTRIRFDRLSESIGTTSDVLLTDLRSATSNMLTDAQAMALATDLLALNIANTSDEAVRFARIVTELDADLGELVLALSNQTTRRFDQLGISVAGFDEKLEALKGTMSDEEAFSMAFLQQAEEQIERVGGVADTTAGDLQRLQATWNGISDDLKRWLLGNVARPALDSLDEGGALGRLAQQAADAATGFRDYTERLQEAAEAEGIHQATLVRSQFLTYRWYKRLVDLNAELRATQEAASADRVLRQYADSADDAASATDDAADALQRFIEIMESEPSPEEFWTRQLDAVRNFGDELADLNRIARGELPDRVQQNINRERAGQQGSLMVRQTDLWWDFQNDLTDISERALQQRAQLEETYEEQRTDLVDQYGKRRAELEADYALQRQREAEQLQRDIADVQQDLAERLEELERDHYKRRQEIIENAQRQLEGAAAHLDAAAVANIKRQRDQALEDEDERYQEQRREAQRAADKRIADLKEHFEERRAIEEEDYRLRLERLQKAHEEQLKELDDQHARRLKQINDQEREARQEREGEFRKDLIQLGGYWTDRRNIEAVRQQEALDAIDLFWQNVITGIPNGVNGGGGNGPDGGGGNAPSRQQLVSTAIQLMQDANWPPSTIYQQVSQFERWTDGQIAKWLERTFNIDVPGYKLGGFVNKTGLAMLHAGEYVVPAPQVASGRTGGSVGDVTFNINGAGRPADTAREVERVFKRVLREMAA